MHFVPLNANLKWLCVRCAAAAILEELKINLGHCTECLINNETLSILLMITTALP
jgi:hypothetical protein